MAGTETDVPPVESMPAPNTVAAEVAKPHSLWWYSWRRMKRNRRAVAGLIIVTILVFVALFADLLAPIDPNRQILEYAEKPTGFRGSVLVVRSDGGAYGDEQIPVQSFRVQ